MFPLKTNSGVTFYFSIKPFVFYLSSEMTVLSVCLIKGTVIKKKQNKTKKNAITYSLIFFETIDFGVKNFYKFHHSIF